MAKVRTKGTALQQLIGTVYTTVAQVISLELPDFESETFECDTLDNATAWIPYSGTGRTETGSISGELFFDPALTSHHNLLILLTTPPAIGSEETWKIVFADTGLTAWIVTGAGFSLGATVALNDGLKASFSIKLANVTTLPTA